MFCFLFFFSLKIEPVLTKSLSDAVFLFPAHKKRNTAFLLTNSYFSNNFSKIIFYRETKKYGTLIVLQFYFCMMPWSGVDPMTEFMIRSGSYDLVLGACHDQMICTFRFYWSMAKKHMIPWFWSQAMSWRSIGFYRKNLVIRLSRSKFSIIS